MLPLISDRKIRVAIVGCGRISKNHLSAIDKHSDNFELIAVCDEKEESFSRVVSEPISCPCYLSYDDMLSKEKMDVVVLCTPSGLHSNQAIKAANRGVHIITEKPMATRWKDGLSMVKACDENNVRMFVVKQNRLNPTLQLLKRAIDEKRFGKIQMVHLNVFWTRPQSYYDQAKWRGTWEMDGGALMNQASHYVDLMDWLIGPIDSVQSMISTHRDIEVEDTGVMNIRWRNGALGSMAVTMCTYPKNLEGSITVIGEFGTVRIGGVAVNKITEWTFSESCDYDQLVNDANYETSSVYGFGHFQYYKNVLDVFKGISEPETDGREGLKSLELLIAAYLSARDGRTISLPLEY